MRIVISGWGRALKTAVMLKRGVSSIINTMRSLTAIFNARRESILGLALFVLTLIAYAPALRDGFVFDDGLLITENPMVRADDGLYRFWYTTEAPDYYPLTWSLWWLEWQEFGRDPFGYHLVNVLLHSTNALLVWIVLRRLKVPGAWLIGAIFAFHPVNVATVAWISEQKNTLSMGFFLSAILLYLRFEEENRRLWYAASLSSFALALLAKPAVVMLPFVLLGCVWWQRGRIGSRDWLRSVPFFALAGAAGLTTVWFQSHRAMEGLALKPESFATRLAAAGRVPWFYLSKAVLPFNLTLIYPSWKIDPANWTSYLPGVLLVICFAVFWWKRRTWGRPLLFGLGYFVVMLFPVLGFLDQGFYIFSRVADHWQYPAIVGAIALMVVGGKWIDNHLKERNLYWGPAMASAVIVAACASTWMRCNVYKNDESLWWDNVKRNPSAWIAHNNLGTALRARGDLPMAIDQFEKALRIKPDSVAAHFNLAVALEQTGKAESAIDHYEQALQLDPSLSVVRDRIARLRTMPNQ